MAKIKIKVDPKSGVTYFPKEVREEGFVNAVEGFANALTVTFIKPGARLADVETSLGILLQDIALRRQQEGDMDRKTKNKRKSGGVPKRLHPLFKKYSRDWLSEVSGYTKSYLCRVARGRIPLTRSFIDRLCFKLNEPEVELFLPEAAEEGGAEEIPPTAEEHPAGIGEKD